MHTHTLSVGRERKLQEESHSPATFRAVRTTADVYFFETLFCPHIPKCSPSSSFGSGLATLEPFPFRLKRGEAQKSRRRGGGGGGGVKSPPSLHESKSSPPFRVLRRAGRRRRQTIPTKRKREAKNEGKLWLGAFQQQERERVRKNLRGKPAKKAPPLPKGGLRKKEDGGGGGGVGVNNNSRRKREVIHQHTMLLNVSKYAKAPLIRRFDLVDMSLSNPVRAWKEGRADATAS